MRRVLLLIAPVSQIALLCQQLGSLLRGQNQRLSDQICVLNSFELMALQTFLTVTLFAAIRKFRLSFNFYR